MNGAVELRHEDGSQPSQKVGIVETGRTFHRARTRFLTFNAPQQDSFHRSYLLKST